ncbi:MAG: hypothetical protein ACRDE2_16895, partial [Chitinophagaceae bacterium]
MGEEITEAAQTSPTNEQIEEWKRKYGKVFLLKVGDKECHLRMPDRTILGYATKISMDDKNPLKFNEILLENCWLAGDNEIKTNDQYFLGASAQLEKLLS